MAGPFDFVSPGAAFADALTQQLAQRKVDQRQQLIDSIAMRAENRAQQEADQMNAYRQQEMQTAQQQAEIAKANEIFGSQARGTDLSHYDPDALALGRKYGKVEDVPVPQTDASVTSFQQPDGTQTPATGATPAPPQPVMKPVAVGTVPEQLLDRQRTSDAQLAGGLLSDPDPTKQALGKAALQDLQMNNGTFSEAFRQRLGPAVPVVAENPYTMTIGGKPITTATTVAPGSVIVKKEIPPPHPDRIQPMSYDPATDTTTVWDEALGVTRKMQGNGPPIHGGVGGKTPVTNSVFTVKDNDSLNAYMANIRKTWDPNAGISSAAPKDIDNYRQRAFQVLGQVRSPYVKQAIGALLRNPLQASAAMAKGTIGVGKGYSPAQIASDQAEYKAVRDALGLSDPAVLGTLQLHAVGITPVIPVVGK